MAKLSFEPNKGVLRQIEVRHGGEGVRQGYLAGVIDNPIGPWRFTATRQPLYAEELEQVAAKLRELNDEQ